MTQDSALHHLLAELLGEGSLDSAGRFTMDVARAREKLAQRQHREAGLWMVKLVQCAHLWEAESLEIRQLRDSTRVHLRLGQQEVDLRPWLERLQEVEMMAHPLFGPLALAFQASLADGCETCWLGSDPGLGSALGQRGALGQRAALGLGSGLKLGLEPLGAADLKGDWRLGGEHPKSLQLTFQYARQGTWWNRLLPLRTPRRAAENFLAASRRAGWALPRISLDRYPVTPPERSHSNIQLERIWLSSAQPGELMLESNPDELPGKARIEEFSGLVGLRRPQGQALRQWVHEHRSDLPPCRVERLQDWLAELARDGHITPPPPSQSSGLAIRGRLHWAVGSHQPATIQPVYQGIALEPVPYTALPDGVSISLSSSRWRTDLHQKRVIQDATSRLLCEWCADQFDHFLWELQHHKNLPEGHLILALQNAKGQRPRPRPYSPFPFSGSGLGSGGCA